MEQLIKQVSFLALCFFGAIISWNIPNPFLIFGSALIGFGLAIYTSFVPRNAGITAPIYAFVEGLFLGGISLIFEMEYPGIAIQADWSYLFRDARLIIIFL